MPCGSLVASVKTEKYHVGLVVMATKAKESGFGGKDGGKNMRQRLLTTVWRRFAAKGSRIRGGVWWGKSD